MFQTKQGDTRTALKATLTPVETLENVSAIRFVMSTTLFKEIINRPVDAMNLPDVIVIFTPQEVAKAGLFLGEFVVEYDDDKIETFPNQGYINITIQKKLGE